MILKLIEEKNYKETTGHETIKLATTTLIVVVESKGKTVEIAVMTRDKGLRQLEESEVEAFCFVCAYFGYILI